jgi:tight adherence protein C
LHPKDHDRESLIWEIEMDPAIILSMCAFGFVASLSFFAFTMFNNGDDKKLRTRLAANDASAPTAPAAPADSTPLFSRVGQAAARPFMPTTREKLSTARRSLGAAGIYSPTAVKTLYGFKFIFLILGVVAGYVVGAATDMPMLALPLGALLGLFAPVLWLKSRIKSNQRDLERGLPDALDLLVVCVEAGLTMDAAMQRVGQELAMVHPCISRELGITNMETRIGLSRTDALRNLGTRTGSTPLQALAAMLTQAERFGTSIAQALRVHAESLRLARQHSAEELAAKSNVKMSFPLVVFIFPATFLVLAGPTVIHLFNSPLFK